MNQLFTRLAFPTVLIASAIAWSAGPIGCGGATDQDVLSTTIGSSGTTQSSGTSGTGTSGTSGIGTSSGQTSGQTSSGQTSGTNGSSSGKPPPGCTEEQEDNDNPAEANQFIQPCMVGTLGDNNDSEDYFYFDITTQTTYNLNASSSGKIALQIKSPLAADFHDFIGNEKLIPGRWYLRVVKGTTSGKSIDYQINLTIK
jgi:hypothetical protein